MSLRNLCFASVPRSISPAPWVWPSPILFHILLCSGSNFLLLNLVDNRLRSVHGFRGLAVQSARGPPRRRSFFLSREETRFAPLQVKETYFEDHVLARGFYSLRHSIVGILPSSHCHSRALHPPHTAYEKKSMAYGGEDLTKPFA